MATGILGGIGAMTIASRWWTLVLRGVAAVIFGLLCFIVPGASLFALVTLFGAYAIVNGVLDLTLAGRGPAGERRWGGFVFEGIVSIIAGVLTFMWPGVTAVVLLLLIGGWAIATGIGQIVSAVRLRKVIQHEWLLGLMGVLSVAFGILMFLSPAAGALAVVLWIGAYAIAFGVLLIALGLRLRAWGRSSAREPPPGAIPVAR